MTTHSTTPFRKRRNEPPNLPPERAALARELARILVSDLAPGESEEFDELANAHFHPRRLWTGLRLNRADPHGWLADVLTPAALAAATALLTTASAELVIWLKGWLRRPDCANGPTLAGPVHVPEPVSAELARWHASTLGAAIAAGVDRRKAQLIADSVVAACGGSLAPPEATTGTGPAGAEGGPTPPAPRSADDDGTVSDSPTPHDGPAAEDDRRPTDEG
ncbi:hypothetical protein [Streptomyces sp. NPDC029721]|uniref:hypothetical protein n=1 Tax=Streptomyces sp. NPDC029721 TaxID=3157090 RepID=UPI0033C812CF